jgi:hypothetical protein
LAALIQAQPPAAAPAAAPPPEPTPQDIQALVKTLQDPVARETLIKQLNALVEVQKKTAAAAPAVPKDIVAEFIGTIADGVARLGDSLSQSWTALNDVDHITAWYHTEIADPARLKFWIRLGWKTGAVLLIAILAALDRPGFCNRDLRLGAGQGGRSDRRAARNPRAVCARHRAR